MNLKDYKIEIYIIIKLYFKIEVIKKVINNRKKSVKKPKFNTT